MKVKINSLGPPRANLIKKGMIYSPSHGNMAFTVPLFDEFMRHTLRLAPMESLGVGYAVRTISSFTMA